MQEQAKFIRKYYYGLQDFSFCDSAAGSMNQINNYVAFWCYNHFKYGSEKKIKVKYEID